MLYLTLHKLRRYCGGLIQDTTRSSVLFCGDAARMLWR